MRSIWSPSSELTACISPLGADVDFSLGKISASIFLRMRRGASRRNWLRTFSCTRTAYAKDWKPGTKIIPFINKVDGPGQEADARDLAQRILRNGNFPVDRVLFGSVLHERVESIPLRKLMAISRLTSKENPLLKTIRLISSGSRRAPAGLAVAEGNRVLAEMDACGCGIDAVLVSEGFGASGKEEALLHSWLSKGVRICRTSENLFRSVSDVRAPQGAIALVRFPERKLEAVPPGRNPLIVFACGIQDPGNLGTIIRAAAAAGASLVCIGRETVSPRNPKAIRASAGTVFRIPIVEHGGNAPVSGLLRTPLDSSVPHRCPAGSPAHPGGPEISMRHSSLEMKAAALRVDTCAGLPAIRIPMAEEVESLNVAMAGAIILFEALRQRTNE